MKRVNIIATVIFITKTNLELPIKMSDTIKKLADQDNLTMSQWVENELNKVLNSMVHIV
jgi:hypothetical protein